jgi:hypothetical protein
LREIISVQPPSRLRIVLDTNQVLPDIWYSAQRDNKKTALQDALRKSEYWAFMAEPVFQEVERKLRELGRGDVDKQITLWRTVYEPHIQTVRLKENAYRDDPRIQAMRDPTDVPTAQLFLFLHPEFLFSDDKTHLGGFPISKETGQVSAAYRDITDIHNGMQAMGVLPVMGIAASSAIWKAFRQFPPLVQMILGGAAVGAALFFRTPLIQKISNTLKNPETQRILEELSALAESKMRQLSEASKYIQGRLLPAPLPMRVLDHIVEILTVIDEPLSLDDIFHYLLARGYQPKGTTDSSKQYVLSLLKKHAILLGQHHGHGSNLPRLIGM